MQYEEYRDRMVAQGRTPVFRERYASQVEAGYMLANLTIDEFCALPDRVIAELSRAANRCAEYDRRAEAAAQENERLRVAVLRAVVEARDALHRAPYPVHDRRPGAPIRARADGREGGEGE